MKQNCLQGSNLGVSVADVQLLRSVNVGVQRGELLGLVGPNGAGKTTLLSAMAGVSEPRLGEVCLDGRDIFEMDPAARARAIAYLPQSAEVHWPLTVQAIVELGRLPHRHSADRRADETAVCAALEATEMTPLAHRTMDTLSGGERMRALVARMLAVEADVLLADEPVTGLDPYYQLEFMDLFSSQAQSGRAVVLVLHDLALAARYCDRLLLLDGGEVIAYGTPAEILSDGHLKNIYRIESLRGDHQGQPYVLPWRRVD